MTSPEVSELRMKNEEGQGQRRSRAICHDTQLLELLHSVCDKQDQFEKQLETCTSSLMHFMKDRLADDIASALSNGKLGLPGCESSQKEIPQDSTAYPSVGHSCSSASSGASRNSQQRFDVTALKENCVKNAEVLRLLKKSGSSNRLSNHSIPPTPKESPNRTVVRPSENSRAQSIRQSVASIVKRESADPKDAPRTCLQRLVHATLFHFACAAVIIASCVVVGLSAQFSKTADKDPKELIYADNCCSVFFFVELLLRLFSQGCSFFTSKDRRWNMFDSLLVVQSIADYVLQNILGDDLMGSIGNTVRVLKIVRIFRIFRIFRFLSELSVLVLMIADSVRSLCWALLMLVIVIYTFAVIFTQLCIDFVKKNPDDPVSNLAKAYFGGVWESTYSLILSMLGGINWGVVADVLIEIGPVPTLLFFLYQLFTMLAVLNIITGVFVENAMSVANRQRSILTKKEQQMKDSILRELRSLFWLMDVDGSGTISLEEMLGLWVDPLVGAYFSALGLEVNDAQTLFNLMDVDETGEVGVQAFLDGCSKLKGAARNIDMHLVLIESKNISARVKRMQLNFERMSGHSGHQARADRSRCEGTKSAASPPTTFAIGDQSSVTSSLSGRDERPAVSQNFARYEELPETSELPWPCPPLMLQVAPAPLPERLGASRDEALVRLYA